MSTYYRHILKRLPMAPIWMLGVGMAVLCTTALEQNALAQGTPQTIVLDPGHGGTDLGVTGPGGMTEKALAMRLAQLIASEFAGKHSVILTRTDDWQCDTRERTSRANHFEADVFLSIHAGSGMPDSPYDIAIYHATEMTSPSYDTSDTKENGPFPWCQLQNRHIRSSVTLAETIRNQINKNRNLRQADIRGAPILVLKGADMPALLIETGQLTHPLMENKLGNEAFLTELAAAIGAGITDYLVMIEKQKNNRIDLHVR